MAVLLRQGCRMFLLCIISYPVHGRVTVFSVMGEPADVEVYISREFSSAPGPARGLPSSLGTRRGVSDWRLAPSPSWRIPQPSPAVNFVIVRRRKQHHSIWVLWRPLTWHVLVSTPKICSSEYPLKTNKVVESMFLSTHLAQQSSLVCLQNCKAGIQMHGSLLGNSSAYMDQVCRRNVE
jgi:hypothetical protein